MDNQFFQRPILNSPYRYPRRRWELDSQGQPTQKIIESRRPAEFITPIPSRKSAVEQRVMALRPERIKQPVPDTLHTRDRYRLKFVFQIWSSVQRADGIRVLPDERAPRRVGAECKVLQLLLGLR